MYRNMSSSCMPICLWSFGRWSQNSELQDIMLWKANALLMSFLTGAPTSFIGLLLLWTWFGVHPGFSDIVVDCILFCQNKLHLLRYWLIRVPKGQSCDGFFLGKPTQQLLCVKLLQQLLEFDIWRHISNYSIDGNSNLVIVCFFFMPGSIDLSIFWL